MDTAYEERTAQSVSAFVRLFELHGPLYKKAQWFRGDGRNRVTGALLPSIARRPAKTDQEWGIYQRFRQNAAAFLPHGLTQWDWMLYMRHYGLHTRLLDWSESALVALYFAVEYAKEDKFDGVVWALDPLRLNDRAGMGRRVQCAGLDDELDPFTIETLHRAPSGGVEYQPVALIASRSFPRLVAQQGVFTVTHRKQISLDRIDDPDLLIKIMIPRANKANIRTALHALGMSRLSVYPELQSLGTGA